MSIARISLFVLVLFHWISVLGQEVQLKNQVLDTSKVYRIEMYDKTVIVGQFVEKKDYLLVFKTISIPRVEIPLSSILTMQEMDASAVKRGEYWFKNPNATRYLFAPSAIPLERGEGYFQSTYIFLTSINVGLSDNLSIGGGTEVISLANGESPAFAILTPKVGFQLSENFYTGGGILYVTSTFDTGFGVAYGVATYGNFDHNITLGMGWGFIESNFSSNPVVTLSGMTRFTRKLGLVSENWFIPGDLRVGSLALRFIGEKISVDFGFLGSEGDYIPLVVFIVKW